MIEYTRSLYYHTTFTMMYHLYKKYLPKRSKRNIQKRSIPSNVTPINEVGGEIDDGTTSTYVSIITMAPSGPVSNKAATTYINISTTRSTRSTTGI